jgi:hypothetical protein
MGTVPVAPRRNRVRSSGERKEKGFEERAVGQDPRRSEIAYIAAFAPMMALMSRPSLRNPRVHALFFHQAPG